MAAYMIEIPYSMLKLKPTVLKSVRQTLNFFQVLVFQEKNFKKIQTSEIKKNRSKLKWLILVLMDLVVLDGKI